MSYDLTPAAQQRMESYFLDDIGPLLRNKNQRASFALYALGILGDGERKSAEPIAARIAPDPVRVTGFLKQGHHWVGVQRQYTGSAGKVTHCQVGVSLTVATAHAHLPVDFCLYLPEKSALDSDRRKEGRIPDEVVFQTKPQLAVQMLQRAVSDGVPPGVVRADSAYGNNCWFREQVLALDLENREIGK